MSSDLADPAAGPEAAQDHTVRNALAALRLSAEGLRDGLLAPPHDAQILDQMVLHVELLSELLSEP